MADSILTGQGWSSSSLDRSGTVLAVIDGRVTHRDPTAGVMEHSEAAFLRLYNRDGLAVEDSEEPT